MLDTHRLALDDDESMSSRVMLFAAQSQEANDVDNPTDAIDMYATVDSDRSRSTQSYDVTVDNPLDTIAAPPKTSQDIYIGVEETELNTDQRMFCSFSLHLFLLCDITSGPSYQVIREPSVLDRYFIWYNTYSFLSITKVIIFFSILLFSIIF